MKKIIDFIVDRQLDTIDRYPELVAPMTEEFVLPLKTAEDIINAVIEWECDSNTIYSLEEILVRKFPSVVTN